MAEETDPRTTISPWIVVGDAPAALDFYTRAFGAQECYRLEDDPSGRVVVAQLTIGDAKFWVQDEPGVSQQDGGGPIRMIVTVADPDAVFADALAAGATEVSAVADEHGWRTGRFTDPFGHHWEVSKPVN